MGKVVSKAFDLRKDFEKKLGRTVTLSEVSEKTGITRLALRRLERGETRGIDFDVLEKLCAFYGVAISDILEYDPNKIEALTQEVELQAA